MCPFSRLKLPVEHFGRVLQFAMVMIQIFIIIFALERATSRKISTAVQTKAQSLVSQLEKGSFHTRPPPD